MAFLGVFWYLFKTFIWKKYSKSKQKKYSGFVKLGVRWAERDNRLNFVFSGNNDKNDSNSDETDKDAKSDDKEEENKSQPWYFHVVASVILVVHGLTFLGKFEKDRLN